MGPEGIAPDAQPQSGQGESGGSGLYDLNAIPEQYREHVVPLFQEWDRNVQRKFQEHADYRKQWEPFESLGVHEVDPTELQELLEFRQLASDPEKFREWYDGIGEELGYNQRETDLDPYADEGGGPDVSELVQKAVQEAVGPMQQAWQEQQRQQQLQQHVDAITQELDALQEEHGEFDRDRVIQMALAYDNDPDAIKKGYEDYKNLVASIEQGLLQRKLAQPEAPNEGGRPASQAKKITDFGDAKAAARELLARSQST